MAKITYIVAVTLLVLSVFQKTLTEECVSRDYGNGGTVCVCNANHCDTISPVQAVQTPSFIKYTSNKAGLRFKKEQGKFEQTSDNINKIIIGTDSFQEILGFGGAFTDSTGINIKSLDENLQEKLVRSYFSEEGIQYSLGRVPIGATDFSTHPYTYCIYNETDPELTTFSLQPEDLNYKVPIIKIAQNLTNGNINLFASAWVAPGWMKTNPDPIARNSFLKKQFYQSWAHYFLKFLEVYYLKNISFWGITTGNEPQTAFLESVKVPSVGWNSTEMTLWIKENLGPTLRKSHFSDIKIMALDDSRNILPSFVETIFSEEEADNYIDGVGVHWYLDKIISVDVIDEVHKLYPDKFILHTEACAGFLSTDVHVLLGSWDRGESYAASIIEYLNHWSIGWTDWNMVLDVNGGPTFIDNFVDAPIIVNATAGEFYKQPTFYAMGHFSKFIPKGSVRLNSSSFDNDVPVTALKRPDGGIVVNILNKKDTVISAAIVDERRGTININLTSKSITSILYW